MAKTPASSFTATGMNFLIPGAGSDVFDRETDLERLARAVDLHDHSATKGLPVKRILYGTEAARPTGAQGWVYVATDTDKMFYHNGLGWTQLLKGPIQTADIGAGQVTQAKLGTDTLQMIELVMCTGIFSQAASAGGWLAVGAYYAGSAMNFDASKFPAGCTVKLFSRLRAFSPQQAKVRLKNYTNNEVIANSETSLHQGDFTLVFSGDFASNLPSGDKQYGLEFYGTTSDVVSVGMSGLLVEW